MRYAGGLLGGSWPSLARRPTSATACSTAPISSQNFENLNPANTFFDKYYHALRQRRHRAAALPRVRALVGRLLPDEPRGDRVDRRTTSSSATSSGRASVKSAGGQAPSTCARSSRRSSLFASLGDNITPPQQAFNWVADIYGSTEEIKARGQVIVGLLHQNVGHLGIFVSGKVAKKEHAQIVSVLKSIEALPPGPLRHADRRATRRRTARVAYDVEFLEHRLEEIVERLNRFERADEKPFEAVAVDVRVQPARLRALRAAAGAGDDRTSSLRSSRARAASAADAALGLSDPNPWLWWLGPAAEAVKAQRAAGRRRLPAAARRSAGRRSSSSAWLDCYREAARRAVSEAAFFQVYGNMFSLYLADKREAQSANGEHRHRPARAAFRQEALAAMAREAIRRRWRVRRAARRAAASRCRCRGSSCRRDLIARVLRPAAGPHAANKWRRIRGEQEIIARYEPRARAGNAAQAARQPRRPGAVPRRCCDRLLRSAHAAGCRPRTRSRRCGEDAQGSELTSAAGQPAAPLAAFENSRPVSYRRRHGASTPTAPTPRSRSARA